MKGRQTVWIVVAAVIVLVLIMAVQVIGWKNRLVALDENTKKAWAQVESQLQRRLDLVPNLVETVKGYAKHEEGVLTEVTKARASVAGATSTDDKIAANNQLSSALSRLLVVVESYPDLKANQNFLSLRMACRNREQDFGRPSAV